MLQSLQKKLNLEGCELIRLLRNPAPCGASAFYFAKVSKVFYACYARKDSAMLAWQSTIYKESLCLNPTDRKIPMEKMAWGRKA